MNKKLKQYAKNSKQHVPNYKREVCIAHSIKVRTHRKELEVLSVGNSNYSQYKGHFFVTVNNIPVDENDFSIFYGKVIIKNLQNYTCAAKEKAEVCEEYFDGPFHQLLCKFGMSETRKKYDHFNVYDIKCVVNENKFLNDMSAEEVQNHLTKTKYKTREVVCR